MESHEEQPPVDNKASAIDLSTIPGTMIQVITSPVSFYQGMAKKGGLIEPIIFLVAMAVLTAVVITLLGLVGFGPVGMMAMGLSGIILIPIFAVIGSFIGAAILFVIWKIIGSSEDYETAYRTTAYTYAYAPVAAVVSGIPYLGGLISTLWPMVLLALASIHVHGRSPAVSWGVFGILGLLLALMGLSAEHAGRQMVGGMQGWSQQMEQKYGDPDQMTPEEAGKALGEIMKGMQQGMQKNGQ